MAAHCALLRVLATPALRASDVRKLTRGAPCFTGLIDGYCSHWLRRLFRPHWAYFALLRAQRARFVRPLGLKGSLLDSATTAGSCPAKSLLFPEGKREVARRKPRRRDRQIQSLIYFRAKVRQFPLAFPQKIW